ncbi:MAG TPA: protein kinase [Candidatus Krumholzibacteria bacterium]|nr:protein kinase [Candidatus Krumholzibacteria bacterium]
MICPRCGSINTDAAEICASCGADLFSDAPTLPAPSSGPRAENLGEWRRRRESLTLPIGFEIGKRYRVVTFLGRGGMGAVYRVHDRELERDVSLKLISSEMDENPLVQESFKREIQLSSIVTHRNVLRVYDLGESEGVKFLTMQYVDGEDLAHLLRREGPLPVDRAVGIFLQICEGVAAAHEQGVLHRDLKPQNVMVDQAGHAYVTDFGLARSSHQSSLAASGAVMGTPDYMSPEQVRGQQVDSRTDIYALGVMFFQMLIGKLPFQGASSYEVMMQRVQHEAPSVRALNPEVPERFAKLVQKCLSMNPEDRYRSVQEVVADLAMAKPRKPNTAKKAPAATDNRAAIEDWIQRVNPDMRPIVQQVDELIRTLPGLQYAIKWRRPFYGLPEQGWIITVAAYIVSVNVEFFGGADFDSPPPHGTVDRSRYVKLKTLEEAHGPMMRKWIEQAGRVRGWE